MKRATRLHHDAMDLAEKALNAQRAADHALARKLFEEAFQKERDAALLVAKSADNEPTRSVLLRSAASLALNCGHSREAERLIAVGLAGNPPEELREELRELYHDVSFDDALSAPPAIDSAALEAAAKFVAEMGNVENAIKAVRQVELLQVQ